MQTISRHKLLGAPAEDVVAIDQLVPDPNKETNLAKKQAMERAIDYMGLRPGMKMTDIEINKVFMDPVQMLE